MQVGCTKKLLDYLGCEVSAVDETVDPIFSFTANLITVNRRKCITVTNDASGCGFVVYGVTAKDKTRVRELIVKGFEAMLRSERFSQAVITRCLQDRGEVMLTKPSNRSAIAKSNRFCERIARYGPWFDEEDLFQSKLLPSFNEDIVKIDGNYLFSYKTLQKKLQERYTESLFDYTAFQLDVCLPLENAVCRRRVTVPADINFNQLHHVIQKLFEWQNYHLHEFALEVDDRGYPTERVVMCENDDAADFFEGKSKTYVETELLLSDVFPKTDSIGYMYDFGDSWEHEIRLVNTLLHCNLPHPVCEECEGPAPPEDCGGVYGFMELQEALADTKHPHHKDAKEWIGGTAIHNRPLEWINGSLKSALRTFDLQEDYE